MNCGKTKRYLGSGKLLKLAIDKHKREKFIRIDLEFFSTKQEAFDAQEKYITLLNTLPPNGYNICPKGGTGVNVTVIGRKDSEETKQKKRGHIPWNKGKTNCYSPDMLYNMGSGFRGKKSWLSGKNILKKLV
jgi:hypothetical protein